MGFPLKIVKILSYAVRVRTKAQWVLVL